MQGVVTICRCAIRMASLLAPAELRREWAEQWIAEIVHGHARLTGRGAGGAEVRRKLLGFAMGSFCDAADLRRSRFDLRAAARHPALCLAAPLVLLAVLSACTQGFRNCREALAALPFREPEQLMLVSRSGGVLGIEAAPKVAEFLEWQRTCKDASLAGFVMEGSELRVTRGFFEVLGAAPRVPFRFVGRTIVTIRPLAESSGRVSVLARLNGARWSLPAAANGSIASLTPLQGRTREPIIFATAVFALALSAGMLLVRRWGRGWLFFFAKTSLVEAAVAAVWAELACGLPISSAGTGSLGAFLLPGALAVAEALALWWSLHDQRGRCPVCCGSLAMPVRIGSRASVIFDRPGVEVVCLRGHGRLWISESEAGAAQSGTWTAFHDSWKECFAQGGPK